MDRTTRLRAAMARLLPSGTPEHNGTRRITAGRWVIWANTTATETAPPHLGGIPLLPERAYAEFDGEPAGWFPFTGKDAAGSVYHAKATIDDLLAALEGSGKAAA